MTDVASALPSAGWYDDPAADLRLRWWDGLSWTGNSMPKPDASPAPMAPPMTSAFTVDEFRVLDSPRRAARAAARASRGDDELATVVQLHPVQAAMLADAERLAALEAVAALDAPTEFDAIAVEQPSLPVDPQPVVPPVTVLQDPLSEPADQQYVPQLGAVPAEVFAPEPVPVVAQAAAVQVAVAVEAPTFAVPAPGTLVGGPEFDATAEAFTAPEALAPEGLLAPEPDVAVPAGLPASPQAFTEETEIVAEAPVTVIAPAEDDSAWWLGLIPSRSVTASAGFLAAMPVLSLAAVAASIALVLAFPQFWLATIGIAVIGGVLPIVLAALDRRALRNLGWERKASVAFVLLGSFWYVVARQVVLAKQGAKVGPLLITAIALSVLVPVLSVVAAGVFQEQLRVLMLLLALRVG